MFVPLYPNTGCTLHNQGKIVFKGRCHIGNASAISVGKGATLIFGDNFRATASLRIACHKKIEFGKDALIGWNCLFVDTDFHKVKLDYGNIQPYKDIISIGNNSWFAMNTTILKGTTIGHNCIVASNSLVNKKFSENNVMLAGVPATIRKTNVHRIPDTE